METLVAQAIKFLKKEADRGVNMIDEGYSDGLLPAALQHFHSMSADEQQNFHNFASNLGYRHLRDEGTLKVMGYLKIHNDVRSIEPTVQGFLNTTPGLRQRILDRSNVELQLAQVAGGAAIPLTAESQRVNAFNHLDDDELIPTSLQEILNRATVVANLAKEKQQQQSQRQHNGGGGGNTSQKPSPKTLNTNLVVPDDYSISDDDPVDDTGIPDDDSNSQTLNDGETPPDETTAANNNNTNNCAVSFVTMTENNSSKQVIKCTYCGTLDETCWMCSTPRCVKWREQQLERRRSKTPAPSNLPTDRETRACHVLRESYTNDAECGILADEEIYELETSAACMCAIPRTLHDVASVTSVHCSFHWVLFG